MIQTQSLGKTFGIEHVLKNVSIEIADGDFVAIVGTSGSGKTTFLNIIGGLDREFEGKVCVGSDWLDTLNDSKLAQKRNRDIGFIFQQFNLLDHLTSVENVMLPSFFTSTPIPEYRALSLLDQMGMASKAHSRPPELSGGQKQRVAIARSLLCDPGLLLCDEPTGSLDKETGNNIMELFRELNSDGKTVLVVTHEEHVAAMADRVIRFDSGQVISDERT